MLAVIQRVGQTSLSVDNKLISSIPFGLAIYLGVKEGDDISCVEKIAKKIVNLRIFNDENGKMNKSVIDVGGQILLISQFTLYGDCSRGNRPSFVKAEKPERANELYLEVYKSLISFGVQTKLGVFGGDMKIQQYNDGPVTIIYEV